METYIGTKLIRAKEMSQGDFNAEYHPFSFVPQSIEWAESEGYLVEYSNGYHSWSPKAVFEKSYFKLINNFETEVPSISNEMVNAFIESYEVFTKQNKITIVIATLKNGFTIVESSACVSPENYSEELGTQICKDKIINQVWNLLGFLLKSATDKGEL